MDAFVTNVLEEGADPKEAAAALSEAFLEAYATKAEEAKVDNKIEALKDEVKKLEAMVKDNGNLHRNA